MAILRAVGQREGRKSVTQRRKIEWAEVDSKVITAVTGRVFCIQLPVPPSSNSRIVPMIIPRNGRPAATLVRSSEATMYQKLVKNVAQAGALAARFKPFEVDVVAHGVWYRERKTGDADGRWKDAYDSLNGIAYLDDGLIKRHIIDIDDTDNKNPRVVITITKMEKENQQRELFGA